mgnify:CR=1 FL=1
MAGKIVADQLEHSTAGSIDTQFVVNGSAKVWIDIPLGSASINDSFNVSSLDDDGTGLFGVNLTSSFGTAFHAPTTGNDNGSSTAIVACVIESKTASAIEGSTFFVNSTTNRTLLDRDCHISSHGDLA